MGLLVVTCLLLSACGLGANPSRSDDGCGACTDPDEVTAALAELARKSRVRPIDDLAIDDLAQGEKYSTSVDYDFREDAAKYERRWVGRSTGSGG